MGGVATAELATAVAGAGALGMLGMPMAPPEVIGAVLDAMTVPPGGAVGVNFLMPFVNPASVEAAAGKARVIEFFYAEPVPALVEIAHAGGSLAAWQVGSADEARAAADAGCDIVIAQGVEAGGHVRGRIGLLPLLDAVLDAVDIPVVAAGGIGSARAARAVMAAGADAVRVGTRFLAAAEADVHPEYLARLIDAEADDTVLTTAFSVMWPDAPHRVLRSAVAAAEALPGDVAGEMEMGSDRVPLPKFAVPCPGRTTTGTIAAMALYAGESVGSVRRVQPAADIVDELLAGIDG